MDMTWKTRHAQASHARRGYELLTEAGRTVVSGMAATLHAWASE